LVDALRLGPDFRLKDVVAAMVASREGWRAFSRFAVSVMRIKEEAERMRERREAPIPRQRADRDEEEWDSG